MCIQLQQFRTRTHRRCLIGKIGPRGVDKWEKGKAESDFHHRKATCTVKHAISPWYSAPCLKSQPQNLYIFALFWYLCCTKKWFSVVSLQYLSFDAFLWKAAISFWAFSCWMLVPYIRRDGKRPSVVFLHSAWRLWRWQSSAANASQRAGFYRQLSKIFMSAARAELKRRIFCATIRERRASLPHSSRLRSSVTLFSDDFAA